MFIVAVLARSGVVVQVVQRGTLAQAYHRFRHLLLKRYHLLSVVVERSRSSFTIPYRRYSLCAAEACLEGVTGQSLVVFALVVARSGSVSASFRREVLAFRDDWWTLLLFSDQLLVVVGSWAWAFFLCVINATVSVR